MRVISVMAAATVFVVGCAQEPKLPTDNPADPESVLYVGDVMRVSFGQPADLDLFMEYTGGSNEATGGMMRVICTDSGYYAGAVLRDYTFTNGSIEVLTYYRSGPDNMDYGIMFRDPTGLDGYHFGIGANGCYGVYKWMEGRWLQLIPWTEALSINRNGANKLAVVCQDSTFLFYANDQYLDQVTDGTYTAGIVALYLQGLGLVVDFDDLTIAEVSGKTARNIAAR